jgi:hypothetical protein
MSESHKQPLPLDREEGALGHAASVCRKSEQYKRLAQMLRARP